MFEVLAPPRVCLVCDRWNQLDLAIVLLSVMGITLEEIEISAALPINPTIIRIMRVLRIARGTQATHWGNVHTKHLLDAAKVLNANSRCVKKWTVLHES